MLVMATCSQAMEGVGVSGEGGTRGIPDITIGATGTCTHLHSKHWMVGAGDRRGVT